MTADTSAPMEGDRIQKGKGSGKQSEGHGKKGDHHKSDSRVAAVPIFFFFFAGLSSRLLPVLLCEECYDFTHCQL